MAQSDAQDGTAVSYLSQEDAQAMADASAVAAVSGTLERIDQSAKDVADASAVAAVSGTSDHIDQSARDVADAAAVAAVSGTRAEIDKSASKLAEKAADAALQKSEQSRADVAVVSVSGTVQVDEGQWQYLTDGMSVQVSLDVMSLVISGMIFSLLLWQLATRRGHI